MSEGDLRSEALEVPSDPLALFEEYDARGWTDGLPIIPPTPDLVRAALAFTDRAPDDVIGKVPVSYAPATVEKVAINAVMAGCRPEFLPVVLAALEAMLEERFGLYSVQATTHPCGPLLVVNGPIARELGMNAAFNAFGPCNRANATIGRAVRLILLNIGGGRPGQGDMSTQGSPCKFTYCVAENEAESPWEPLHVELGYAADVSTVTVVSGEAPHNFNNHESTTASGILHSLASAVANSGANTYLYCDASAVIALGPEHAATLATGGLTKQNVRDYVWEHATVPVAALADEQVRVLLEQKQSRRLAEARASGGLLVTPRREDLIVIVLGGPGKHSAVIHSFGLSSYRVTRPIARRDGTPVRSVREIRPTR